jgi:hypothetical protein
MPHPPTASHNFVEKVGLQITTKAALLESRHERSSARNDIIAEKVKNTKEQPKTRTWLNGSGFLCTVRRG